MIEFDSRVDVEIDISPLEAIASFLSKKQVELILTDDDEMRALNKERRGVDAPTDVLSFPIADFPLSPLGSIVISIGAAQKQADTLKHDLASEIAVLFLHGMLHLLGMDHETDNGEMAAREKRLRKRFNLPIALTER
ncbi:MAG: rRNA maturation RNase YbeY [Helicobacteraceae bacterium]|nr:rRNA maturation RNase YbeY [Helicobacteraceae bacterium]